MVFKHQGSILYLFGYLIYIWGQPSSGKLSFWLICLALISFGISLLASLLDRKTKDISLSKVNSQLAVAAESAGSLLTLLFALTFIPKAHFMETHLALFGLLILTFLATRNILPGLNEIHSDPEAAEAEPQSTVSLPANRF
jgi:hypothetical protein